MPSKAFSNLEAAAKKVLSRLQQFQELQGVRVVVIGGLALWRYLPSGRRTYDVDLLIDLGHCFDERIYELPTGAPALLKWGLSSMYPDEFWQLAKYFQLRAPKDGFMDEDVPIDLTPKEMSPYIPAAAMTIAETKQTSALPYISALDLLVFKIHSCGMRLGKKKRFCDAKDAEALVSYLQSKGPIQLSSQQKDAIASGLDTLVEHSRHDQKWWKLNLGLE